MTPTLRPKCRSFPRGIAAAVLLLLAGCAVTTHQVRPSSLGVARSSAEMLAVIDAPGPVTLETVDAADWSVDRSGVVNLDSDAAKAAGLKDGLEPVTIRFHALRHPTRGLFIVDTGVEVALRDHPENAAMRGTVASFMHLERMKIHTPLAEWLHAQSTPLQGVFFTHLHPDHITGAADVPAGTPVFVGPGEAQSRSFGNLFLRGSVDRALEGKGDLQEWPAKADASGRFEAVVDVFGDGSVWALWVPGHTPGSMAYLVRTPTGPVLLTGDTSATRWGWEHDVEGGSFTEDRAGNSASLARLRRLAQEHPKLEVRLGHQALGAPPVAAR